MAVVPKGGEPILAHSLLGDAEVTGSKGSRPVVNPATGESFGSVSLLDEAQATSALDAAWTAFPAWAGLSHEERRKYFLRARDALLQADEEVAELVSREQGKPPAEALLAEIIPSLETLKHLASHAGELLDADPLESELILLAHKQSRVEYVPFGVVLVITPWNYPFSISLMGVATALAAGNTVVLKPAPSTTLVGLKVGDIFRRAGLPPGVLNVVAVDDEVAGRLVSSPKVSKIVFTGSVGTGKKIMAAAAANLTPVVLELGGKDPAIVCRDADLDRAAQGIVWGAFMNAGQTCASVERVYVEREVFQTFVDKVVVLTKGLKMGDPRDPGVEVGPLSLQRQRALVEEHVAEALQKGALALTGGKAAEGSGYFYPPTVLTRVDHSMRIMREETFGPVLPIMEVSSVEEAIRWANDSPYGLTASGWTKSPETASRLESGLAAGSVTINDCVFSFGEPAAPWGGFRQSGIGRTHGLAGLREMVQPKYVSRDSQRGAMLWWYPYGKGFARLARSANRALNARSFFTRFRNQLRLLFSPRFLRRVSPVAIVKHIDKLF